MTTAEVVDRAGRLLAETASALSKVILFGSYSRNDASAESDFDFLVIEPSVQSKAVEMVRLRAVLDPLKGRCRCCRSHARHALAWDDVPGMLIHDAVREGRVLAET